MPLALGALGFALNSYSTMVTACGFPLKNRSDIDANQEFIALGVADIGAGLLQGFAISGADSRTTVNGSIGGRSQLTASSRRARTPPPPTAIGLPRRRGSSSCSTDA